MRTEHLKQTMHLPPPDEEEGKQLSNREVQILQRSLLPDKIIADQMNISYHTVKSHLKNIKMKTGMLTTRQVVYYATKKGYIL